MEKLLLSDNSGALEDIDIWTKKGKEVLQSILTGKEQDVDSTGWLTVDEWAAPERLEYIEKLANKVKQNYDTFVLVGVGGSNQAARAAIKALCPKGGIQILYMGNTLSATELSNAIGKLKGEKFCINIIAKNFETLEPGLSFRLLRKLLHRQHGPDISEHIYVTVSKGSQFEKLSKMQNYNMLVFPKNIGGRYSVISDVGLFPMAVAGVDIRAIVAGAKSMCDELQIGGEDNPALKYAAVRNCLYSKDYRLEMLSYFEPRFRYFSKWWTQLFAESEGKDNRGIYPVVGEYSEDLHSIGQYVQDGTNNLFETFLSICEQDNSLAVEKDKLEDGFGYLEGKSVWKINDIAEKATIEAHSVRFPVLQIQISVLDEHNMGRLFYFFMFSCYLSGKMLGINPFSQDGVEAYKRLMFDYLENKS